MTVTVLYTERGILVLIALEAWEFWMQQDFVDLLLVSEDV